MKFFYSVCLAYLALVVSIKMQTEKTDLQASTESQEILGWIRMAVDDELVELKVNGQVVPISYRSDLKDVSAFKEIFHNLDVGNVVEITAKDYGGESYIGSAFTFTNKGGKQLTLGTDQTWTCNGKPAKINTTSSTAATKRLPSNVKLIWADEYNVKVTCIGILSQPVDNGQINVVFDDFLDSVSVNEVDLPRSPAKDDWLSVRTFNTPLQTNDVVKICGRNASSNLNKDPASIISTINFFNNEGERQTVNTNTEWKCEGQTTCLGLNKDPSTIWYKQRGKEIVVISSDAHYIWGNQNLSAMCCSIKLLKPRKEARLTLQLESYLEYIKINDKEISFTRTPDENWLENKYFSLLVRTSDRITFKIQKKGASIASMIATLNYVNSSGYATEVSTGATWICDDQAPMVIKKQPPICPDVSKQAKWITSAVVPTPDVIVCSIELN